MSKLVVAFRKLAKAFKKGKKREVGGDTRGREYWNLSGNISSHL